MATIRKRKLAQGLSWQVQVRRDGLKPLSKTFSTKTDAKAWAADIESDLNKNTTTAYTEAAKRTLSEAIDRYITEREAAGKLATARRRQLDWWRGEYGSRKLGQVTCSVIIEARDTLLTEAHPTRKERRKPATVNRYLAALSHVLSTAVDWEWLPATPRIKRLSEPKGRDRFLDRDELERLLGATKAFRDPVHGQRMLHALVLTAVSTGARSGELLGLTWKNVNLAEGWAVARNTKNGEHRRLHLSGTALGVIKELGQVRDLQDERVFRGYRYRDQFQSALNKAGISDFRFHDLRHTAASHLAMNGATLAEIAEVLGHKTLAMVKRYAHLQSSHVSSVVERMNQKLFG